MSLTSNPTSARRLQAAIDALGDAGDAERPTEADHEALVVVHLSSLDAYEWMVGPKAAEILGDALAERIVAHRGPLYLIDQGWPLEAGASSDRRRVLAALRRRQSSRRDVTRLHFDEDTAPWGPFLERLSRKLLRDGVERVVVAGLWWSDDQGGCASTVYRHLASLMPTAVASDAIGREQDA